ncbi:hypothetical protein D3C81_793980 [compost metagenome]
MHQKQPLPAVPAIETIKEFHDRTRQRPGDQAGEDSPEQEHRDHPRTPCWRVPEGQVEQCPGGEAGFEGAQQKAQHIELCGGLHEHHGHGDHAPADHDAQQRLAHADLFQHQVAGHLEQQVADEEDPRAQRIDGVAERQCLFHLQLRVTDVDAIKKCHDVGGHQQRHDAPADFSIEPAVVCGFAEVHACLLMVFVVIDLQGCGAKPWSAAPGARALRTAPGCCQQGGLRPASGWRRRSSG